MNSCHPNRAAKDQIVLGKICFDILNIKYQEKPNSDDFCGIFLESRNRAVNSYEEYASMFSFKAFSQFNYPIFAFVNENIIKENKFLDPEKVKEWRINLIPIQELATRKDYAVFNYKFNVFNKLGGIDKCVTLHPDGFLIKEGWEEYVIKNDFDFIGAKWLHCPSIRSSNTTINNELLKMSPVYGCNGGFSYRKASVMNAIINKFNQNSLNTLYENGRADKFPPPEDLFFNFFGWNLGLIKPPTKEECDIFSLDPITLKEYNNQASFGFHCPLEVNPWK